MGETIYSLIDIYNEAKQVFRTGEYRRALDLFTEISRENQNQIDRGDLNRWIGDCLAFLGSDDLG